MEFTIYRKSWRRGGASKQNDDLNGVAQLGTTQLLNSANMFCCLGMVAVQHGVKPKELLGIGDPFSVASSAYPKKTVLIDREGSNSFLTDDAIDVNDKDTISEAEREKRLKRIFAKRGHTLKFVNRLAPKAWRVARQ